jgi:hypothetical protein
LCRIGRPETDLSSVDTDLNHPEVDLAHNSGRRSRTADWSRTDCCGPRAAATPSGCVGTGNAAGPMRLYEAHGITPVDTWEVSVPAGGLAADAQAD